MEQNAFTLKLDLSSALCLVNFMQILSKIKEKENFKIVFVCSAQKYYEQLDQRLWMHWIIKHPCEQLNRNPTLAWCSRFPKFYIQDHTSVFYNSTRNWILRLFYYGAIHLSAIQLSISIKVIFSPRKEESHFIQSQRFAILDKKSAVFSMSYPETHSYCV